MGERGDAVYCFITFSMQGRQLPANNKVVFNFFIKEMVMNKLNLAVLALVFAILGGCATAPGDVVGTVSGDNYAGTFPSHSQGPD
jgi:hypothetical protein